MAQSYIRQGTCIVCSNMTCGVPRKLGVSRKKCTVINGSSTQPILNADDKKVSECFDCKNPKSFWGGLVALCVGICIGIAIGAAIVATGGAAAVAMAACAAAKCAMIVTAAVAVVSIVAYTTTHDCDVSLQGTWKLIHDSVLLNGKPALLNQSFLDCPQKGKIFIILNENAALEAAKNISKYNNREVYIQWGTQILEGCITGLAAQLTGGAGYCEMGVEVGTYILSESTGGVYGKVKSVSDTYDAISEGKSAHNDVGNRTRQVNESTSRINQYEGVLNDRTNARNASIPGRGQQTARTRQSQAQRGLNVERARNQDLNKKLDAAKKGVRNAAINFGATATNAIIDLISDELKKQCSKSATKVYEKADNADNKDSNLNVSFMGIVSSK
nr:PAAR-like protein [uncultured Prevotella sp.]